MTDILLTWNAKEFHGDIAQSGADLATGDELATAVIISLLTWRRANDDDELPDESGPRHGWWGDTFAEAEGDRIGCRWWLLRREKLTAETIARAEEMGREALQWLIDDGVASRVDIALSRRGLDGLDVVVTIYRTDGTRVVLRFPDVWAAVQGGA